MRALVIGFGSIGRRHARLLVELGLEVAVVSRREVDFPDRFASTPEAVDAWRPDYVVVASRTDEHLDDFKALAGAGFGGTVLVEKPLFAALSEIPPHAFERVHVAYNLRFHPVIAALKAVLEDHGVVAVHAYVGHYLPDWRPDTDYRRGWRSIKALGGGVLRDLSHELDYVNWMLGGWLRLTASGGHLSALEIDSDDVFSILLETDRCPLATVQLNFLDSVLHRRIVALTDSGTARADLVAGTIEFKGNTERFTVGRDDTYLAQHRAALNGEDGVLCSLAEGFEVTAMIEAAERAARDRVWVGR